MHGFLENISTLPYLDIKHFLSFGDEIYQSYQLRKKAKISHLLT